MAIQGLFVIEGVNRNTFAPVEAWYLNFKVLQLLVPLSSVEIIKCYNAKINVISQTNSSDCCGVIQLFPRKSITLPTKTIIFKILFNPIPNDTLTLVRGFHLKL